MTAWRTVEAGDFEGRRKLIARGLGARAVKLNQFDSQPGQAGSEHDERESGQEEVNVIVRGSGTYRIDGEEVPVRTGDVFRFDPETTRCPVAGPDGMALVAVGAPRGSYSPRGPF